MQNWTSLPFFPTQLGIGLGQFYAVRGQFGPSYGPTWIDCTLAWLNPSLYDALEMLELNLKYSGSPTATDLLKSYLCSKSFAVGEPDLCEAPLVSFLLWKIIEKFNWNVFFLSISTRFYRTHTDQIISFE